MDHSSQAVDSANTSPIAPKVLIGTSGYSYDDWVGRFYPEGMNKSDFLAYYAEHFSTVEINYTYYRMPAARTLESMARKSSEKVEFVLKLHADMTHQRTADPGAYRDFVEACVPLTERGLLGGLLAQFPFSFHLTEDNADYLRRVRDRLPDQNLVVEFRNAKWVRQETFAMLKELQFGFCCVDEPQIKGLMPPVSVATSDTGYVRFHGRNQVHWYHQERPEQRYDYRYSKAELAQWIPKIKSLAALTTKIFCFTNNHYQSKAVDSAQILMELLKK